MPIPYETLTAICSGEIILQEFSKMRVFNTLYSASGIPHDLKSMIWCQLSNIQNRTVEERESNEQMFSEMATKQNEELDEMIT